MPKDTFFRLPKEKQDRLLEAASEEFSRVPLQEASIANIVRIADIPRGSFYQYFEDKEDLYYHYFDTLRSGTKEEFEKFLASTNGDLFAAFEGYFERIVKEAVYGPNAKFYKNLFMHMDFQGTDRVSPKIVHDAQMRRMHQSQSPEQQKKVNKLLLERVDMSKLTITEPTEVRLLIKLLMSMVFTSINYAYKQRKLGKEADIEEIVNEFMTKLGWLKNGVYKKEEVDE